MVAGIWFHWMSESDLWRVTGPGGGLILLLLPGFKASHPTYHHVSLSQADTRLIDKV
ncbi:hypothetical protein BSF44_04320 [Pseudomonas sp. ACN8]|uniref:Uncharacterized protein n=1 Tax=Pseudomonas fluorescens TaxID=294 RepID=A0A5E7TNC9_PSEFL|nr:hypothetical protein BSF44_04320 [Pseudomonas sp. ACN8]VVP99899.1 hypothetical protein PS938_02378 [Pseudomonas fluorescens]